MRAQGGRVKHIQKSILRGVEEYFFVEKILGVFSLSHGLLI